MLTLHEFSLSGNCHKVRLLLSLLGLNYQSRLLNSAEREHKTEDFLQLNNNTLTIADIAIYPYIALVNEGKFDLEPYLYVQNWMGRIEHLTGYVTMPGIQRFND